MNSIITQALGRGKEPGMRSSRVQLPPVHTPPPPPRESAQVPQRPEGPSWTRVPAPPSPSPLPSPASLLHPRMLSAITSGSSVPRLLVHCLSLMGLKAAGVWEPQAQPRTSSCWVPTGASVEKSNEEGERLALLGWGAPAGLRRHGQSRGASPAPAETGTHQLSHGSGGPVAPLPSPLAWITRFITKFQQMAGEPNIKFQLAGSKGKK